MVSFKTFCKRVDNQFRGNLDERIFFLHIPKCGGTSIRHAIRLNYLTLDIRKDRHLVALDPAASANVVRMTNLSNYPHDSSNDYPIFKLRENILLYFMSQKNTRYVSGHFSFSDLAYNSFFEKFSFITLLRDPVKRWISTYFYNKYKDGNHFKIDKPIEDYIESDFGKSQGYEYVKFLGGPRKLNDYTCRDAILRTKENIHKFDVIGILENVDSFVNLFFERFGIKLNIEVKNRNPKPVSIQKQFITSGIEDRIREICQPDYEIYQYVIRNFTEGRN